VEVLTSVNFGARRGDRIVIIGRNGAGKSSLLRCLAGVQAPSAGAIELGTNVQIGYFAQEHEQVNPDVTVLENLDNSVLETETERRALLACSACPARPRTSSPDALGWRARQAGPRHAGGGPL